MSLFRKAVLPKKNPWRLYVKSGEESFAIEVLISEDNVHVYNSYKVDSRSKIRSALKEIQAVTIQTDCRVFKERSEDSLVAEWCVHNLLYDLHLWRSRTADVDLNIISVWEDILYRVVSIFYWR